MSGLEEKAEERRRRIKQEKEDDDDESQEDASSDSDSEEAKIVTAMLKQRCALRSKLPGLDLKSYRNTVPVPKVDVEGSERVIEKPPYKLPSYIAATGIEKAREAWVEREHGNEFGATTDIDYEVLYDAFFKHQTKPRLTTFGDLYYEGKEFDPMSLRDEMKKWGLRGPVRERKRWGDLEDEEDDMVVENEKKKYKMMEKVGKYKN